MPRELPTIRISKLEKRLDLLEGRVDELASRVTRTPSDPVTPEDRDDVEATEARVVVLDSEEGEIRKGHHGYDGLNTTLKIPPGAYRKLRVIAVVRLPPNPAPQDGAYCWFWLYRRRDGKNWRGQTLAYLLQRGKPRDVLRLVTVMGEEPRSYNAACQLPAEGGEVKFAYSYERGDHQVAMSEWKESPEFLAEARLHVADGEPRELEVLPDDEIHLQWGMRRGKEGPELPSPEWFVERAEVFAWPA